jgi:hypothetical protein
VFDLKAKCLSTNDASKQASNQVVYLVSSIVRFICFSLRGSGSQENRPCQRVYMSRIQWPMARVAYCKLPRGYYTECKLKHQSRSYSLIPSFRVYIVYQNIFHTIKNKKNIKKWLKNWNFWSIELHYSVSYIFIFKRIFMIKYSHLTLAKKNVYI